MKEKIKKIKEKIKKVEDIKDEKVEVSEEGATDEVVEETKAENNEQKLQSQLEELNTRYLRQMADFDNFRKRTAQEKEDLANYSLAKFITELLPVVDNFERALSTVEANEEMKGYLSGIEMVQKQFMETLTKAGLKEIEAVGQVFDPNMHEAIMQVEDENFGEDVVVEDLRKGYMFKEKVLRPSMCKVNK